MEAMNLKISLASEGEIVISGVSSSDSSGEKSENSIKNINNSFNTNDIWVIKLDSNGNKVWDRTIGGDSFETGGNSLIVNDKIYILASSESGVSGNKTAINKGDSDYWLICLDMNGNILWDRSYGGSATDNAAVIIEGSNSNELIIAGNSHSPISGDKTVSGSGSSDFWIIGIDTLGNIQWQDTYGGSSAEMLQDAAKINNREFLFAGSSFSGIGRDKTEASRGDIDFWLLKVSLPSVGVGLDDVTNSNILSLFPNPATATVYVNIHEIISEEMELRVYDMNGKIVLQQDLHHSITNVNVASLKSGLYLFNVFTEGILLTTKKIVVN